MGGPTNMNGPHSDLNAIGGGNLNGTLRGLSQPFNVFAYCQGIDGWQQEIDEFHGEILQALSILNRGGSLFRMFCFCFSQRGFLAADIFVSVK